MDVKNTPVTEKYLLTVMESVQYFNIGENKIRNLAAANPNANWYIRNGNRILIKRKLFEKYLDNLAEI